MNHYETVFIMNPVLSEDQVKETVKRYISYLKTNKARNYIRGELGIKKIKIRYSEKEIRLLLFN